MQQYPHDHEEDSEEQRLMAAFQNGDHAAFDTLFHRYAGRLLAFARRLTGGSGAEAEDLVQDTFVAAFRSAEGFRGGARVRTWLFSIAVRRLRDTRRRQPKQYEISLTEEHSRRGEEEKGSPTERAALATVAFDGALQTLDTPLREAFLLVAAQGLTHKEAAAVLNAPIGTVKWRVAQATRRMRAALEEENEEETHHEISRPLPARQ